MMLANFYIRLITDRKETVYVCCSIHEETKDSFCIVVRKFRNFKESKSNSLDRLFASEPPRYFELNFAVFATTSCSTSRTKIK